MTSEQEHGGVLNDLAVDDHLVDGHIAQGSLVRAFRTLAEKVEVALSAGAPARSPRVIGAFFASMAAWQLAYLRSRGAGRTTATSADTPHFTDPPVDAAAVIDDSRSLAVQTNTGDHCADVTPVACSPGISPNAVFPIAQIFDSGTQGAGHGEIYRRNDGNYVAARADEYDVDDVSNELIDRAHRRKYNRNQLHRTYGVVRRTSSERILPATRQRRELAMV